MVLRLFNDNLISIPLNLGKTGAGTVVLSGTNTYTGGTNIGAGTLNFTTGGLGTTSAVTFTGNSTLQYGTATTTDLSSRLAIGNGVTGTVDTNGNNVTFATGFGASGSGALTKTGAGTLTLSGANTYTGATRSTAGTILLTNDSALGNSTVDMNTADSGAVSFGPSLTTATFGALTGSRNLSLLNCACAW